MAEQRPRTALVTGATSGIGLAVTRHLAGRGNQVFLCSPHADAVHATVRRLRGDGLDVDGVPCDLRNPGDVRACVRAAVHRYGPVDILVTTAGRFGGGPAVDLPEELWSEVIDTNLTGVFLMAREVLNTGGMRYRAGGRIINVASTAGRHGTAPGTPYSATRHGVVGFTKALGKELAKSGITVNAVCPGFVETPLPVPESPHSPAAWELSAQDMLERHQSALLGRYSTPEEVAGMVGYLASEIAAGITAQAISFATGGDPW